MPLSSKQLQALRRDPSANRVRVARKALGLTQVQVCEALGFMQPYLSDVERRRYAQIGLVNARRLADFFGCAIEDLFPSDTEAACGGR